MFWLPEDGGDPTQIPHVLAEGGPEVSPCDVQAQQEARKAFERGGSTGRLLNSVN